jgi:hypothetical protein
MLSTSNNRMANNRLAFIAAMSETAGATGNSSIA